MTSAWDRSHGPARPWAAGPWSLELRDDEIADIAWNGRSVLRSVRAVVRDRNWDTVPLVVDGVDGGDASLTLAVRSSELGSSFRGTVRVDARPTGLSVTCDLESAEEFATNRTGLVVLHPPSLAGAPLRITHPGGAVEESAFPVAISPHQPAFDIAELAWLHDGLEVDVRFSGDVFEMEDQRNWTDASFKTYSRPLSLPFPYVVSAGERVVQSVSVAVRATVGAAVPPASDRIELRRTGAVFPAIGTEAATAPDPAPGVAPVGAFVVVELDLATPNWRAALRRAQDAGLPLDVRLVVAVDADLHVVADALRGVKVARVAAFGASSHVSDADVVVAARAAFGARAIFGGSRSHFTELNREHRSLPDDLDGLITTVTPLFHSRTTEQLVESVQMQRLVAVAATELTPRYTRAGAPVVIGPISLRPRYNNVSTTPAPVPDVPDLSLGYGAEFNDASDDRQSSPELGAWLVASAAALAVPGVAALAYFEEWGPRGLRDASGEATPALAAFEALSALAGGELLSGSSDPRGLVWAVGSRTGDGTSILLSNLDRSERDVTVECEGETHRVTLAPLSWRVLRGPESRSAGDAP